MCQQLKWIDLQFSLDISRSDRWKSKHNLKRLQALPVSMHRYWPFDSPSRCIIRNCEESVFSFFQHMYKETMNRVYELLMNRANWVISQKLNNHKIKILKQSSLGNLSWFLFFNMKVELSQFSIGCVHSLDDSSFLNPCNSIDWLAIIKSLKGSQRPQPWMWQLIKKQIPELSKTVIHFWWKMIRRLQNYNILRMNHWAWNFARQKLE